MKREDLPLAGIPLAADPDAPRFTLERIESIERRAPALLYFTASRPDGYRFTPGHYARLGLGVGDDLVWRPYSIASAADDDQLAFHPLPLEEVLDDAAFIEDFNTLFRFYRNTVFTKFMVIELIAAALVAALAISVAIGVSSYTSESNPIVNALTGYWLAAAARPMIEQESMPPER